jgi:soluble lytic murein transglycosylase-like protein
MQRQQRDRAKNVRAWLILSLGLLLPFPGSAWQSSPGLGPGSAASASRSEAATASVEARSAHTRIVSLTDEQGHRVYVDVIDLPLSGTLRGRSAGLQALIDQTASRFRVDPRLVHAVVRAESDYNPKAVSPKGAMGLMQLVPATAHRFGVANPFDPEQNLKGGVGYLRYLLNLFGNDVRLSLAAYNAGENSVLRRGGVPPYGETQRYVRKVTTLYHVADPTAASHTAGRSLAAPIYSYVDAKGVVHFEQ